MNLKKFLAGLSAGAFLLAGSAIPAFATSTPNWNLGAPKSIVFGCGGGLYHHTLNTVSENSAGNFSGTGTYDPDHSYTWNITGNVSGDNITFTLVYTGSNLGYTLHGTGTVASNGSVSGTTDGNCQTFSMSAGSATPALIGPPADKNQCKKDGWKKFNNPSFRNQGQCVSFVQRHHKDDDEHDDDHDNHGHEHEHGNSHHNDD